MKKKVFSIFLILCIMISITPIPVNAKVTTDTQTKKVTKLSSKNITLKPGQKKTLKLKNYTKLTKKQIKKVKWTVSNKKTVTIKPSGKYKQSCKITAKKEGKTTIKLKYNGKTYKCSVTVKKASNKTHNHTHKFGSWTISKPSTCAECGVESRVCNICGFTETKELAKLDHSWSKWTTTKEPTCEDTGMRTKTCISCGIKEEIVLPEKGHAFKEPVITKEPTCKEEGIKTFTCSICNQTVNEPISNEGIPHEWGEDTIISIQSCGEYGRVQHECKICGEKQLIITPPTRDCVWDEGIVTTEPTCGEPGERTYTCKNCHHTKTEIIYSTQNHTWNEGVITKEPTCGEDGIKTYTCTVCKKYQKTENIQATGNHQLGTTYKITHEPTYSCAGIEELCCDVCGKTIDSIRRNVPCKTEISCIKSETNKGAYAWVSVVAPNQIRLTENSNTVCDTIKFSNDCEDISRYIKICSVTGLKTASKEDDKLTVQILDSDKNPLTEEKTYTYNDLTKIFTKSNQTALLCSLFSYETATREEEYRCNIYRGSSLMSSLMYVPAGTPVIDKNTEKELYKTEGVNLYLNHIGLSAICKDMGYKAISFLYPTDYRVE